MIILLTVFIGSAILAVVLNAYWVANGQNGYNNSNVAPVNGALLVIFFGSLLLLGLTFLLG